MGYEKDAQTITDAMVNGGLFYGRICVPTFLVDILLIIVCPPIYVLLFQIRSSEAFSITPILTNIILTSCFYFPGFIHALYVKQRKKMCGSLLSNEKDDSLYEHGMAI